MNTAEERLAISLACANSSFAMVTTMSLRSEAWPLGACAPPDPAAWELGGSSSGGWRSSSFALGFFLAASLSPSAVLRRFAQSGIDTSPIVVDNGGERGEVLTNVNCEVGGCQGLSLAQRAIVVGGLDNSANTAYCWMSLRMIGSEVCGRSLINAGHP